MSGIPTGGDSKQQVSLPTRRISLIAQGHLLRVKVPGLPPTQTQGGTRGTVTGFSNASRKRMLEFLARIDIKKAGFVAFVTLTYPDQDGPPEPEEQERDRATFFKRMHRAYPDAAAIWRREYEERKSGAFAGVPFPHFHMIFFNLPFVPYEDLNTRWKNVLRHEEYLRTEIKGIKSWHQAQFYVSKYMAKGEPEHIPPPSSYGGDGDGSCSLVYGAYSTVLNEAKPAGRPWGVFGRKRLPLAERTLLCLDVGRWLKFAQDLARHRYPGVPDSPNHGFTLFMDEPGEQVELMVKLYELLELGVIPEGVTQDFLEVLPESVRRVLLEFYGPEKLN